MVAYMLTASAMHIDSGKRYQCKQDITVMPSNAVAPPLQVEDFRRDYALTSTKAVKRHIWSRPIGKLTFSAMEPQPLNMATNAPRASTTAPIRFFFRAMRSPRCATRLYNWSIIVRSFLRIRTYITTRPFKPIPTQEIVEIDPLVQMDSKATSASLRHAALALTSPFSGRNDHDWSSRHSMDLGIDRARQRKQGPTPPARYQRVGMHWC